MFSMDFSFVRRVFDAPAQRARSTQRHNTEIKQFLRPAIHPSRLPISRA
jgi:hypothetical protein